MEWQENIQAYVFPLNHGKKFRLRRTREWQKYALLMQVREVHVQEERRKKMGLEGEGEVVDCMYVGGLLLREEDTEKESSWDGWSIN